MKHSGTARVKEFGPLIVSIDTKGNNMFEENKVIFNRRRMQHTRRYLKKLDLSSN